MKRRDIRHSGQPVRYEILRPRLVARFEGFENPAPIGCRCLHGEASEQDERRLKDKEGRNAEHRYEKRRFDGRLTEGSANKTSKTQVRASQHRQDLLESCS